MTPLYAIFFLAISIAPSLADIAPAPPHPGPRNSTQAQFLYDEGTNAESAGKIDLAILNFKKVIDQYPHFPLRGETYLHLIKLHLTKSENKKVLEISKEALLTRPGKEIYTEIQLHRITANLNLGNSATARQIADELLKTKPELANQSLALALKAEAFSREGKHKEAAASLDAAKHEDDTLFTDTELKLKARACKAIKITPQQELLSFFQQKNLCLKEAILPTAKTAPKSTTSVWCEAFTSFEAEFKKAKMDSFTREKLQKEIDSTTTLALNTSKDLDCHGSSKK